ncbi:MAG: DEAD/DEAH box helicase [Planctomycetota bacterium]
MSFEAFGLHPSVMQGVKDLGFSQPSPIQSQALPPGLAGQDLLACAATGSGKTAAFVLPILNRLISMPRGKTRALIVTPTRELAHQIDEQVKALGRHTGVRCATIYGGVGFEPQRQAFHRGIDVIVATPGRLLDHLRQPYGKLDNVELLVLDEADRMLDMGFLPDIQRILARLTKPKQSFLFSATMPPDMQRLARELLRSPFTINLERQGRPAAKIEQRLYEIHQTQKPALLLSLAQAGKIKSALVFTRTKRRADRVAEFLQRNGVASERIHGDRSQGQRTQALESFKRGKYKILVATDVAARGIDVQALSHVINYDMPGSTDDYIHRVGRTARAEATGEAYTFVTPEDHGEVRALERRLNVRLPRAEASEMENLPAAVAAPAHAEVRPWQGGEKRSGPWNKRPGRPAFGKPQKRGNVGYAFSRRSSQGR